MTHLTNKYATEIEALGNLRSEYLEQNTSTITILNECFDNTAHVETDKALTERILDLNLPIEAACSELNIPQFRYLELLSKKGTFDDMLSEIEVTKDEARDKLSDTLERFFTKLREVKALDVPFLNIITNGLLIEISKIFPQHWPDEEMALEMFKLFSIQSCRFLHSEISKG